MDNQYEIINRFLSRHEFITSNKYKNTEMYDNVKFTMFGHTAGLNAIYEILSIINEEERNKVLNLIKNK